MAMAELGTAAQLAMDSAARVLLAVMMVALLVARDAGPVPLQPHFRGISTTLVPARDMPCAGMEQRRRRSRLP